VMARACRVYRLPVTRWRRSRSVGWPAWRDVTSTPRRCSAEPAAALRVARLRPLRIHDLGHTFGARRPAQAAPRLRLGGVE
jgi:hypothetical protein